MVDVPRPLVGADDTGVPKSLVCVQWCAPNTTGSSGKVMMIYLLGATEAGGSQRFAEDSELSRRELLACDVRAVKQLASEIRYQLEEADGIGGKKGSALRKQQQARFVEYLRSVATLLTGSTPSKKKVVRDALGNDLSLACDQETMMRLERLFDLSTGVDVTNDSMCHWLRDLLG